jgi:hypothetical protein
VKLEMPWTWTARSSLKSLITEAASTSGANLTEAQTDGAASIMEASSKAKEDAKASASTVTELATEVSRVQAVSQSKAADDLEAVGAQTADLESTVLAYTGAAMQQQVQTEVVGDFNASSYEEPSIQFSVRKLHGQRKWAATAGHPDQSHRR